MRYRPLYSACNEDTSSEIRALQPSSEDTVVCIAAGGGRALSLLSTSPARVIAVDARMDQIFNLELKAAALDCFSYESFREFLGVDASSSRREMYSRVRPSLTVGAQAYWDARGGLIDEGVLYAGRLETALARFCRWLRNVGLFAWPAGLLNMRDLEEQRALVNEHLLEAKMGALYWAMFCNPVTAWLTMQDPSFMRCTEGNLGRYLYGRFIHYTDRKLAHESYFLHLLYFGKYSASGPLPIYLTRQGYDLARKKLGDLELSCSRIETILPAIGAQGSTKWSLSDISCWMSERQFQSFLRELVGRMHPGDRFCYRNFGAQRMIPQDLLPRVERLSDLIERVEAHDTSVFFRLEIGEARGRS